MSDIKPVYVAVIGPGGVGAHFLKLLHDLSVTKYPYIKLVAVTRSNKAISTTPQEPSIPIQEWEKLLTASTHPGLNPSEILQILQYHKAPNRSILVDNTSNEDVAKSYPSFLTAGISVITPNKKAFSGSLDLWKDIFASSSNPPPNFPTKNPKGGLVYHESTVGAGLPILNTLTDLLATGDRVHSIEGVFSGTMSYLFNTFAPSSAAGASSSPKWSATVSQAASQGYTEPDPRDDLNGADVARKLVILARMCASSPSFSLEKIESISSFPVQSLIPSALASAPSASAFLEQLPAHDAEMDAIKTAAASKGKIVRYVGKIDVDKAELKVGLSEFDAGDPVAGLKGADNLVAFHTERYNGTPMVVQGGGAGGEVTAMGVAADLVRVLQRLG